MVQITIDCSCPTCDCKLPDMTGCCKGVHRVVQVVTLLYLLAFTVTAVVLYSQIDNDCARMDNNPCVAAGDRCSWRSWEHKCYAESGITAVGTMAALGIVLVMLGGITVCHGGLTRDDLFRPSRIQDVGILILLAIGFLAYIIAPIVAFSTASVQQHMGLPNAMSALSIVSDILFAISFCCAM